MKQPLTLLSTGIALLLIGSAIAVTSGGSQKGVADSAADAKPLGVGVQAPNSTLLDLDGTRVKLSSVLGGKPTVLIFYRGGWCPFCNAHLSDLATIQDDILKRGYQIVAISPDTPAELNKMRTKDKLPYQLYSDSHAAAMKHFGVAFRLDDPTFTKYKDDYHIDIEKASGNTNHILPVPSVFIIDSSGKIVFVHSNPDYKVRMKGSEVLKAIDDLKSGR